MKLQDPTLPYASVVSERRRERAEAGDGERFRLGASGLSCESVSATSHAAVVGASAWALEPDNVEATLSHIGLIGGILADLGYSVCAMAAISELPTTPAFVAWVSGETTTADEREQLARFSAPGLAIGAVAVGLAGWGSVQPDEYPDDLEAIRATVAEIHTIIDDEDLPSTTADVSATGGTSTASSTGPREIAQHGSGRTGNTTPRKSSATPQSGTQRDRKGRPSSGS